MSLRLDPLMQSFCLETLPLLSVISIYMKNETINIEEKFVRTPFVWALYLILGLFSFMLSMIGPMVPYLQAEFGISYTIAGLHQSIFAFGMVGMGFFARSVIKKTGITASIWGGMAIMLIGLLIMVLAPVTAVTLSGVLIMSLGGTVSLSATQTAFANFPSAHRGKVIMEANVMASALTMLVPVVLFLGSMTFFGWRIVFLTMFLSITISASFGFGATKKYQGTRNEKEDVGGGTLGAGYWRMWIVVFLGVTVEWSISFWCMTYLLGLPGNSMALATAGTVLLGFSAVSGRFISSRINHKFSDRNLMLMVMALVLIGFPLYWLRATTILTFLGLALCGLGSSVFYPLGLSMSFHHAPGNAAKASSLMPVASGGAIGLAPFLLGSIADRFNMQIALWYVPFGIILMLIVIVIDSKLHK